MYVQFLKNTSDVIDCSVRYWQI